MKRTKDGRFIAPRLKINRNSIDKLLAAIKSKNKWTWEEFAHKLGVSEYTLRYAWRNAKTTLPEPIVEKLKKWNGKSFLQYETLQVYWGQKHPNSESGYINIPQFNSEEFAEFYGAMLGDGCIYRNMNSLCITCNSILDKTYVRSYLTDLCISLFKINPKIYESKHEKTIRLVINNKKLVKFLVDFGFPVGKKNDHELFIPASFFKEDKLLVSCLRGIADTDGGIYSHPNAKIMFDITSRNKSLLSSIYYAFCNLGLKPGLTKYRIQLYCKEKLRAYFNVIGSKNPRNFVKYLHFIKKGKVPNTQETERLLKAN